MGTPTAEMQVSSAQHAPSAPSGFVGGEPKRPHIDRAQQPFEELTNVQSGSAEGDGRAEVESVVENDVVLSGGAVDPLGNIIEHDAQPPKHDASAEEELRAAVCALEAAVRELREQFPPPPPPAPPTAQ